MMEEKLEIPASNQITNPRVVHAPEVQALKQTKWKRVLDAIEALRDERFLAFDMRNTLQYNSIRSSLYKGARVRKIDICIIRQGNTVYVGREWYGFRKSVKNLRIEQ